MKTETKHTPTPWIYDHNGRFGIETKRAGYTGLEIHVGSALQNHGQDAEANAAFIVKAVNAYQKDQESIAGLLGALKAYTFFHDEKQYEMPEDNENEGKRWQRIRDMAGEAIARAEGNQHAKQ